MKLRLITLAVMAAAPALVNAAALERTNQSIAPLFEKGNYAELSYVHVDPEISGTSDATAAAIGLKTNVHSGAKQYGYTSAALKLVPTKDVAVAVLYDEPFGVDYEYDQKGVLLSGVAAEVNTQNITSLIGTTIVPNVWVYGGLAFQDLDAEVTAAYDNDRNPATPSAPFNTKFQDSGVGYVGGVAFEKPEIALRAALTYRSEVEHKTASTTLSAGVGGIAKDRIVFNTPQSVNLDFQTGISPTTLLMLSARWVEWSKFKVAPTFLGGASLTNYAKDQFSGSVGIGRKLTNNFSAVAKVAYDSGTGDENISVFGPYTKKTTLSVGGKYKFSEKVDGSLGVGYTMLGDADLNTSTPAGNVVTKFKDSDALAIGGKIGFHF